MLKLDTSAYKSNHHVLLLSFFVIFALLRTVDAACNSSLQIQIVANFGLFYVHVILYDQAL